MAKTGRQSFQFMLRLPDDLRERLRVASEASGRSMTAEIVYRLEGSFEIEGIAYDSAADLEANRPTKDRFLYVAIDQDGSPVSYREIWTLLEEIAAAAKVPLEGISARVFEPKLVASDEREEEWVRLRNWFKAHKPAD
ncbi:MAG TPA: Arc family DNA-binding protein [Mesorhizobium sp.]|jgi:plasmid stability protein|nr:Arc family DNA-binding protein [Mesorhizobium sp.]